MFTDRRNFLKMGAMASAGVSLSSLAAESSINPLAAKQTHFQAKAKRVIVLFMEGGPSQVDLFDHKPLLYKMDGKPMPVSAVPKKIREGKGEKFENFGHLARPSAAFKKYGQSGLEISDFMPNVAKHADDLCILSGMHCDSTEHGTATQQFHTGMPVLPRPSMASWMLYGLGTENANLPGAVVVSPPAGSNMNCGTDFLPAVYQPTILRDAGKADSEKIRYLASNGMPLEQRKKHLSFLQRMNERKWKDSGRNQQMKSMIESMDLAFRMQAEAPEIFDFKNVDQKTLGMYGIGDKVTDSFGRQCLTASRLAASGVRYIQVTNKEWDHHSNYDKVLTRSSREVDQPIGALLADLKRQGLLEDTLVVWGGEFGRTPVIQYNMGNKKVKPGKGHNPFGYTMWMAGGGVKGGMKFGETDEFGYSAVSDRTHVHDLHATILHLMGVDHERLTYRHGGRDYRLTDVFGNVVKEILV